MNDAPFLAGHSTEYCGDTFSNEEVHKQPLGIKLEFEQLVKQLEDILDNLLENGEKA